MRSTLYGATTNVWLLSCVLVLAAACSESVDTAALPSRPPAHLERAPVARRDVAPVEPPPSAPLALPVGSVAREFTARFIEHTRRNHPELRAEAAGDLAVRLGDGTRIELANLWDECATDPTICDVAMDRWGRGHSPGDAPRPPRLEDLRISLFPSDVMRSHGVPFRPWAGPLVQCVVVDTEDTIGTASEDELQAFGIGVDAVWRRALDNLRAALPGPIRGRPLDHSLPRVQIGVFPDSYGAARLLLHERWAAIAANGPLLAAGPARDIAIWITSPDEREARAFRGLAQQVYQHEPHPISPAIVRWTPKSWVLEDENERPVLR